MEYNPVQTLNNEHDIISLLDDIINNLYHSWNEKPDEYTAEVKRILTFLMEYSDQVHHGKEEEILFPALRNCMDFTLDDLLTELETHHERFRDFTQKIQNDLEKKDYAEAYAILREYCNELFVLAESILSPDELEKIYFRFEDLDREIGLEKKDELEAIVLKYGE